MITTPDGRRWAWYAPAERHEVKFVVKPDPRDERIAELEAALRHIRQLSDKATWLTPALADGDIFNAIYLLAADALAGETQQTATTYEAMAI